MLILEKLIQFIFSQSFSLLRLHFSSGGQINRYRVYMGRVSSLFSNLGRRQKPTQIGKRSLCSDQFSVVSEDGLHKHRNPIKSFAQDQTFISSGVNAMSEEFRGKTPNLAVKYAENQAMSASEIAKEVCNIIRTRLKWENTLLNDFPTISFTDPSIYNEIMKQQSDLFLSLRFYLWLRSLDSFSFDPALCKEMCGRLAEAKDVANIFLDGRELEVEPWFLKLYKSCLSENELIDQVLNVLERLKMIGHVVSLETWNWALSESVGFGRVDVVWRLHEDMVKYGSATDVNTMGYFIQAFCLENNVSKAYQLLHQVLKTGQVPNKIVFDNVISVLGRNGKYGKVSAVVRKMIANNCYPDIHTYHEVIRFCRGEMTHEGVRIFSELKKRGYFPHRVMYTALIDNLCENKDIQGAWRLWFEMIEGGVLPNKYTYNVFVSGLLKNGCIDEAEKLLKEMLDKGFKETSLTFNTRIYGLCINDRVEEAQLLLDEMNEKGIVKDAITYNSMIQGFSKKGKTEEATHFLDELVRKGFEPSTASLASLIATLCNDGHVKEAEEMWVEMQEKGFNPGDESISPIVYGLSKEEQFAEMKGWLDYMIKNRVKPKMITFENLIKSLCGACRVDDALFVLHYMVKMGYLLRESICYSLVDALCGANHHQMQSLIRNILQGTEYQKHWSQDMSPLLSLLDRSIS